MTSNPTGDVPADSDLDSDDTDVSEKAGGLGEDGTIPPDPDGVAAGHTGEASTFEPEEDEGAPA
ncbi:hypothetical protein LJR045_002485 [Microbacterium sp. LjRoot45]|uniref:Uncharacterized protein n=1 Tax=Candidatus Microbacterium phytovorans TaxID=3121374 RepID=A0AAJ5W147_9MICO|nr:hypothetical protein [Microbacterium sp.]WEK12632.1 MAG: hypothetical protein P0Y48_09115 [Microbacterium sp.]